MNRGRAARTFGLALGWAAPAGALLAKAVLLEAVLWGVPADARAAEGSWLSGERLGHALAQHVAITWSNTPLRRALANLSQSQRIALLLDRRIDPDQKIELALDDVPLEQALGRVASECNSAIAVVGPVVYIGPKSAADRIRTLVALRTDDVKRLPQAERSRWIQPRPWPWDDLVTPRELLSSLAQQSGIEIVGLDRIEHDLWAAADLPPMTLAQRLTLVLTQLDLTYELDPSGRSIRLLPLPERPVVERSYPVSGNPRDVAARLRNSSLLGDADIQAGGGRLVVSGRQEDHDAVANLLSGRAAGRAVPAEARKVYSLRVTMPVGKLLDQLSGRLNLEIRVDREAMASAGLSLEKEVSLDVSGVTADELLQAVLEPAGLTFRRQGSAVVVTPQK